MDMSVRRRFWEAGAVLISYQGTAAPQAPDRKTNAGGTVPFWVPLRQPYDVRVQSGGHGGYAD